MRNKKDIICIAGKNQIALNATKYLLENLRIDKERVKIITNADDFGIDSWQPSFKKFALENNLQITTLEQIYKIPNLIFISLEFDKIINPNKFQTRKLYNMHFSLLPAYKGVYTAVFPLLNGERIGGVSFHKIDCGIDTGDIIAQKSYTIEIIDTAYSIYLKNLNYAFVLFKEVIECVLSDMIKATPQSPIGASYYSKKSIDFTNIVIDFNKTSYEIYNQIRAFIFPPYQLPKIDSCQICKCTLTNEKINIRKIIEPTRFIISGIDGFKIIAYKVIRATNGGGGGILLIARIAHFYIFYYFLIPAFLLRFYFFKTIHAFHFIPYFYAFLLQTYKFVFWQMHYFCAKNTNLWVCPAKISPQRTHNAN